MATKDMKCKFSVFAKKHLKLSSNTIEDGVRVRVYVVPKHHIFIHGNKVIDTIFLNMDVSKEPGVKPRLRFSQLGDDSGFAFEYDEDLVSKWRLYKRVR